MASSERLVEAPDGAWVSAVMHCVATERNSSAFYGLRCIASTDHGKTWRARGGHAALDVRQRFLDLVDQDQAQIARLQAAGVITVNRSCLSCRHYQPPGPRTRARCLLLATALADRDLRVDCPEHEPIPA